MKFDQTPTVHLAAQASNATQVTVPFIMPRAGRVIRAIVTGVTTEYAGAGNYTARFHLSIGGASALPTQFFGQSYNDSMFCFGSGYTYVPAATTAPGPAFNLDFPDLNFRFASNAPLSMVVYSSNAGGTFFCDALVFWIPE